jgi:hypothetical protein
MTQDIPAPTPQQIELARWVASLGAVTAEALAHRLGTSVASARARLAAAQHRNLLARKCPLAGRPALFSLTRAGLRACDAHGIQACSVSGSNANHLIMCAAVAAGLERSYPDHRLIGECELRRDERERDAPLASARLSARGAAGDRLHRPDLVLLPRAPRSGLPVAVEVELTVKSHRRLVEICRAWARCRAVAGVLYLVSPAVERPLSRAVEQARAGEQIEILPLIALPGVENGTGEAGR